MTLMGAINHIDAIKPNAYKENEKKKWLSTLDGLVFERIWATHEDADIYKDVEVEEGEEKPLLDFYEKDKNGVVRFKGYNSNTPLATEMLVPAPFDEIYIKWLEAQIDYATGEFDKYNNSMTMFNSAFNNYVKYYNRTHMPIAKGYTHF